jgi:succinyl-diaminopimelate desuccinylase
MLSYLELATQLIALRTDPGAEARQLALDLIAAQLSGVTIEWFERNGQRSFLAYAGPQRPARFRVILNGHVDVIPGKPAQYHAQFVDDRLYGVGALDMKSNLAVMCAVFQSVVHQTPYPLALQVVSDEETGGFDGTAYQIESGVHTDFVISGETTQFAVVHQAKGIVWLKIHAHGETAHGAYPWRGRNALDMLHQSLTGIGQRFPLPADQAWVTTVNVARIETPNTAFNKVPDTASAWLDVRCVPADADHIVATIQACLHPSCTLEVVTNEPALQTAATHPDVVRLSQAIATVRQQPAVLAAAQGSSDARHYARVGTAGVEFGPIGGGIASDHEWTSIPDLAVYAQVLQTFLQSLR